MKDCDFIPAGFHEARTLGRAVKVRASCVGTLIAIMVLWIVAHHHRIDNAEAMLPEIRKQQDQIAIHLAKKQSMEAERSILRDRQSLLERLGDRASLVVVFSDISRRLPETVVLTELSMNCPSLARPSTEEEAAVTARARTSDSTRQQRPPTQKGGDASAARLSITGIAVANPEVVRFAAALENSPLFDRVQMEVKGPTEWAGRRAQRFELTCELVEQRGETR